VRPESERTNNAFDDSVPYLCRFEATVREDYAQWDFATTFDAKRVYSASRTPFGLNRNDLIHFLRQTNPLPKTDLGLVAFINRRCHYDREIYVAFIAGGRFDGDAGSGNRKAASGGAPWDGRRATVAGRTITFAPTFTRS
jgi:hypothetical protein